MKLKNIILDPTFKELLFGDLSGAEWKFQFFLITLGIFLRVLRRVYKRNDKEYKPSISYWIKQVKNWAKLIYSIILMYVLIRFFGDYEDFIKDFIPKKLQASIYLMMILLGFFLHKISDLLDSYNISKTKK